MPFLRGLLRVAFLFALAMLVVTAFARRAWAYPGVIGSDYGFNTTTGCSKPSGCHNGTGPDATTTSITYVSGGAGGFSGGTLYVNPSATINFTVTISTKAGSVESEKGINVWTSGYQGLMSSSDAPAHGTADSSTFNNEITFSPAPAKSGDSVSYSFSLQAPGSACTAFTLHAWGNSVKPSDPTGVNQAGHAQITVSSKCGNGTSCGVSTTPCISGQCWDGVCCDRSCGSTCDSCLGSGGVCHPVTSPRAPGCGGSGVCAGFCSGSFDTCSFPTSTVCGGGTCSSGTAVPPVTCTASGTCPGTTTVSCAPYACNAAGTACNSGCAVDGDCGAGNYCSGGTCVAQSPPGAACTANNHCLSNFCVDGVCCTTACTEQCGACNLGGSAGTCTAVTGAPVGGRPPCATDGSACGGACDGATTTACAYPSTSCRTADCTAGVATLAASCDGKGACPLATTTVCSPYACSGTACGTTCTTDAECATGNWCQAGKCVPKSVVGASCGTAAECTSGNCVDFVCCDKPCSGSCEACDVAGHIGTCSTISGAPHGTRTCPVDPTSGCPGTCDGTSPSCATSPCDAGAEGGTDAGADSAPPGEGGADGDEAGADGGDTGPAPFDVGGGPVDASGDGDLAQPNENGGCACHSAPASNDSPLGVMAGIALGVAAAIVRRRRRR